MDRIKTLIGATALAASLGVPLAAAADVPAVEPKTQAFLDQLAAGGGAPIYTLTPEAARQVLEGAQAGPVAAPRSTSRIARSPAARPARCGSACCVRTAPRACCR